MTGEQPILSISTLAPKREHVHIETPSTGPNGATFDLRVEDDFSIEELAELGSIHARMEALAPRVEEVFERPDSITEDTRADFAHLDRLLSDAVKLVLIGVPDEVVNDLRPKDKAAIIQVFTEAFPNAVIAARRADEKTTATDSMNSISDG